MGHAARSLEALRGPTSRKVAVLGALYFVQGMPYGFMTKALPVYLRTHGFSLTLISLSAALNLPWLLKWLWAPLVDRWGSARFGRRKVWLVPLQVLFALACGAAAAAARDDALGPLLAAVAVMNLLAATQDVATDGLAVGLLRGHELGPGNAAQVVGAKVGTLVAGGGFLVAAGMGLGWAGAFLGMAALTLGVTAGMLAWREPREEAGSAEAPRSVREVLGLLWRALRLPGTGWLLAFVATYKFGETMGDVLFKPFLVDAGYAVARIGLWDVAVGTPASIVGSLAGGVVAARLRPLGAVGWLAALRCLPLFGRWALAASAAPADGAVVAVLVAEELLGGALTTAMFAFMMARVDPRVGATHFTVLATVEVLGKAAAGPLAGTLADTVGAAPVFALGALLSVLFLALLLPLRREPGRRDSAASLA
jgi:MFS transporter, PAT family, beta-lactamase induction signal transducer AmpG